MMNENTIYENKTNLSQLCKIVEDEFNASLAAGFSIKEACKAKKGGIWIKVLFKTNPHLRYNKSLNIVEVTISTMVEGQRVEVVLHRFKPTYR